MRLRRHVTLLLLGVLLASVAWLASLQTASARVAGLEGLDPVIAAAGDIACDPTSSNFNGGLGSSNSCRMKYTSDLLVDAGLSSVLLLGDNQYYCGGYQAFQQSYDLSWGRVKSITRPAVGNHEFLTSGGTDCNAQNAGAAGYFRYFGAAAGSPGQGYYSFDVGSWHLIALNTNCSDAGGCGPSTAQGQWLRADLAAHPNFCTLAYWHIPLFSSGGRANNNSRSFWDALYAAGADIVLTSHDHLYERFGKQKPDGTPDAARGIREWVVGTGGANHTKFTSTIWRNSEVRDDTTYGVLRLTLHATSYDWQFVPEAGKTFTDSGTTQCHGTSTDTTPPSAPTGLTATATGPNQVDLSWSASTDDVGISGYRIYRNGTQIATVTGTTYRDSGVQPGSTNGYTVVAVDSGGNVSQASNTASATTPADTTPPSAPTGLSASSPNGFQVDLSWTASSDNVGVAEYQVWRGGAIVGTSTTTSYTDSGVDAQTTYTYTLVARDGSNNVSGPSNAATITTPAAPTTLTFAPAADAYVQSDQPTTNFGASSQITVDASPSRRMLLKFTVSGVRGRPVQSAKLRLHCVDPSSVGGAFHRVANTTWGETTVNWNNQPPADTATIASLGSVSSGVTHEIDVTSLVTGDGTYTIGADSTSTNGAYYSSREGAVAPQLVVTTGGGSVDQSPPTAPTNLTASASSATRVDLTWTASSDNVGVTDYQVFRGGVPIGTSTTTSYSDTNAQASTTYSYTVKARDAATNVSAPSNTATVTTPAGGGGPDTTPPTAPTNLTASAPTPTRVDLAWTASTDNVGVTSYEIFRDGTAIATSATNSYADTTVQPNTGYSYTVKARDAATNASSASNTAVVTTPQPASTLKFTPDVDSYVDTTNTTNYGTSTQLRADGSPVVRAYLRFTVQGVVGTVTSAKLRIYANSASSSGHEARGVTDTSWGETTINGGNAPLPGSVVGSSGTFPAGSWTEVDVTSQITGNGTYSLAVTTPGSTAISYASREATNKPELVVTVG